MIRSAFHTRAPFVALLVLLAALAFAGSAGTAEAIPICGDNVCAGKPFETPTTCPEDCGAGGPVCGDGICHGSESCGTCLADCADRCITLDIFGALKQPGCAGDDDNDCLNNVAEEDLAFWFSPHYFYDEDEECSGAPYTSGGAQTQHFGRRDFFQVRPKGEPESWKNDADVKRVDLTYFFLHPHDCRWDGGFAGHVGDSEHVVFHLASTNLTDWTLTAADYHHHGLSHTFGGGYLKKRADEIGTPFPSVAADENSHGSWPGRVGWDSDCAGSEDDFCLGTCDCFRESMQTALQNNFWDFPLADSNIGGPPPEEWRPETVAVSGFPPNIEARSILNVGHGFNPEFWTPRTDIFKKFCGWECTTRTADGNCVFDVHGRRECATALSEKVDDGADFTPPQGAIALPEWEYDLEVAEWLGTQVRDLVLAQSHLPAQEIETWLGRLRGAIDPIGVVAPLVAGRPLDQQHQTLAWILQGPRIKHEAVLGRGLVRVEGMTREEIEHNAGQFLGGLVAALEELGYRGLER